MTSAESEVLLVHRPRYDDWSLPKGKLKRREHPLAGAVREVLEETGVHGVPGIRLPTASYQVWAGDERTEDGRGRRPGSRAGPPGDGRSLVHKQVEYWAMTVAEADVSVPETFRPTDEVDDVAWLPVGRALRALSYPHDRRIVGAYGDLPALHRPVVLLRHARAGDPWPDPDGERPLDPVGERQAAALASLLPLLRPQRLMSAEPLRCRQTLAGLARAVGIEVEIDPRFDEGADPGAAARALLDLSGDAVAVVCSEGGIIPATVSRLSGRAEADHAVAMGDALVLSVAGGQLIAADPLSPVVS